MPFSQEYRIKEEIVGLTKSGRGLLDALTRLAHAKTAQVSQSSVTHYPPTEELGK